MYFSYNTTVLLSFIEEKLEIADKTYLKSILQNGKIALTK